jgi:hypothetical protein
MRWMMYNHRVISFVVFTSAFWGFEVMFACLSWMILRTFFTSKNTVMKEGIKGEETDTTTTAIKPEPEESDEPDLSDTPRTFPTYGRQPPLRYEPKVKEELESEDYVLDETIIQPLATEADDEDDDDDDDGEFRNVGGGRTDSGIGTSYSEAGERVAARRRSRGGLGSLR